MMMINRRWQTAVGILLVLFLATACFQQVGDQGDSPQVSLQITATPTEEPSLTPTEEPTETEEPVETEEPTEETDAQAAGGDEDEAVDLPIAEEPTETPTLSPTAPEVAQLGESGLGQFRETETPEVVDEFSLTATHIIETATANALVPTWTADALTQQANQLFATPTPTIDPNFGGFATATPSGPVLSGADCVHEVRTGDTLFRMSIAYGIPVMDIANRNGITNPDLISVGQMLVINGCGTTGVFPPATSFPTEPFGTGGSDLSGNVGGSGGGGCQAQYTVNQYDTLFQISMRYGVSVQSIANANGISNINVIDMGSVLCIPAS